MAHVTWGAFGDAEGNLEDECIRLVPELVEASGTTPQAVTFIVEGARAASADAQVVSAVLARWPQVRVMLTADHALGASDEAVVRLEPLDDEAALSLWETTRRTLYPKYTVEKDAAPQVIELVRELDGLPGAIREAAQHPLPCEELSRRLRAGVGCDGILAESTWPAFDRERDECG